jgi:hypothetical protein
MTDTPEALKSVPETADGIELTGPFPQDVLRPERSILPPVEPPSKLPVMGVPTAAEAKPVDSEYTRFRSRSKYRAWA